MLTLSYIVKHQQRYENLTYIALWAMLFIAPVLSLSIRTTTDTSLEFDWHEILIVWRELLAYLVVFLLHNFLLAPLLVYKQKRWTYFALTAAIVVVFALFQCSHRPEGQPGHGPQPPMEQFDQPRPMAHSEGAPPPPPVNDRHDRPDDKRPPMMMGQHDIISTIVLILMLGMNIGVKLYFKRRTCRSSRYPPLSHLRRPHRSSRATRGHTSRAPSEVRSQPRPARSRCSCRPEPRGPRTGPSH